MKAIEYTGRVLPDGHLEIPAIAKRELQLQPNVEVKVILMREEETPEEQAAQEAERARKRHEVWQAIMELHRSFEGMDFSLTDELVRSREEEDACSTGYCCCEHKSVI